MVLFLIILILLALTGLLRIVLGVALGVALGIFLGAILVGAVVAWRIRRALSGSRSRWRRVQGSRIEVLDRGERDR
jgi:membrane protein implicated in regulation of membrane protease activity